MIFLLTPHAEELRNTMRDMNITRKIVKMLENIDDIDQQYRALRVLKCFAGYGKCIYFLTRRVVSSYSKRTSAALSWKGMLGQGLLAS